jgi:hypothetical protein
MPPRIGYEANHAWVKGTTAARPHRGAKMNKSFLVLFFKKEQEKNFFLKKEAKTFVNCSFFDDIGWSPARRAGPDGAR